jgi:hypothetical protein
MDSNVFTALIVVGSSVIVALTALMLSHRGFSSIGARFVALEVLIGSGVSSTDDQFGSIERRFDTLHCDMQELSKRMWTLHVDLALIKDRIGRN